MDRISNYDITLMNMEKKFAEYDHDAIASRLGLKSDANYIYIRFIDCDYRISRRTGHAERSVDDFASVFPAVFNDAMTIYDIMCHSDLPVILTGKFAPVTSIGGTTFVPGKGLFGESARFFDDYFDCLSKACMELGGTPASTPGDLAFTIPLFDFMPVVLQFWKSDEEFDAVLKLLWDTNTLRYMHFETTYYAASHLFSRLKDYILRQ